MARPGVTKEQVFSAANTLKSEGTAVTIVNVRNHLGTGSPNTVHRYLADWKLENIATKKTSIDISDTLKKALLSEIQHINEQEVGDFEQRLKDAELDNQSLSDHSAELVEDLEAITSDRDRREAQNIKDEALANALRVEVATSKQTIDAMNTEKVEFGKVQQQLETALAAAKELKEGASNLEAKNRELSNQIAEARTEIAVGSTKLVASTGLFADVSKRLEVAASKLSDAETEVKALNSELTATKVALSDAKGLAVGLQKDVKAKDVEIDKLKKMCDGLSKKIEVQKKSETKK